MLEDEEGDGLLVGRVERINHYFDWILPKLVERRVPREKRAELRVCVANVDRCFKKVLCAFARLGQTQGTGNVADELGVALRGGDVPRRGVGHADDARAGRLQGIAHQHTDRIREGRGAEKRR